MKENLGDIEIVFEDEYFLAINKPSGLVVHGDGRTEEETLVDWVQENYPNLENIGNPHTLDSGRYTARWGIVNRLDRETSGLILIVKDSETFENLQKQFLNRTIVKEYIAKVHKKVSPPFEGGVANGRGGFKISEPLSRHKKDPRIWVCGSDNGARQTVRDAETEIEVIESGEKYSLLRMFPKTGRTHQLRLHAKFIGHPIVGDKKYSFGGIDNVTEEDKNSRLMLHAKSLELLHPKTGEKIKIETAIPF